jgi:HEAT repeat protein
VIWWEVLEFGLLFPGSFVGWLAVRRTDLRDWADAAERAGLEHVTMDTSIPSIIDGAVRPRVLLTGLHGRQRVRVETFLRVLDRGVRVVVETGSRITLRLEHRVTDAERSRARDVQIGDPAFDDVVYVQGREDVLRAILDADTRRVILGLLHGETPRAGNARHALDTRVSVLDGDLTAEVDKDRAVVLQSNLPGVLADLLPAAARLQPPNVVPRLVENLAREPEAGVCREILRTLAHDYPRHPATREALERGCRDEREEVQLEAALGLGADGRTLLREIACRQWAEDGHAALAMDAVGSRLTAEEVLTVLAHALRTVRRRTARAGLDALGAIGDPSAVPALGRVAAIEAADLAIPAVRALARGGHASAEAPLLKCLRSEREPAVRVVAAEALGVVGTAAAVGALRDAIEEHSRDRGFTKAAREAVVLIQSRLEGASPGQLSLAEGEDAAGRVSLTDDPQGRLSLPGSDTE